MRTASIRLGHKIIWLAAGNQSGYRNILAALYPFFLLLAFIFLSIPFRTPSTLGSSPL